MDDREWDRLELERYRAMFQVHEVTGDPGGAEWPLHPGVYHVEFTDGPCFMYVNPSESNPPQGQTFGTIGRLSMKSALSWAGPIRP